MSDVETKLRVDTVVRPPTRWRNCFYSPSKAPVLMDGAQSFVGPGKWWGPTIHASKEIAEERAAAFMSFLGGAWASRFEVEYLGAFPVDGDE